MIEVVAPGPLVTVQDLGRPGFAHLGVSRSGAADPASLRLANRLVGNLEQAAALEITCGMATLMFHTDGRIALTGAPAPAWLGDRAVANGSCLYARAGQTLRMAAPSAGLRTYLAVAGGLDVDSVLGSRSTDTLSGLGPSPLRPGRRLHRGDLAQEGFRPVVDHAPERIPGTEIWLRLLLGPRDEWFTEEALRLLSDTTWEVTTDANRVGVRLRGPRLLRRHTAELPSEGMVPGAVQVPPSGQPIVFLSDHPTTGGYPVVGVVRAADLRLLAQARPGTRVHFLPQRHIR